MNSMLSDKKHFIFFDFDGVIANSFKTAFSINNSIFPDMDEDKYRRILEGNVHEWDWESELKKTDRNQDDVDFFQEYNPRLREEVEIFPGVAKAIKELAHQYVLIVISSSSLEAIQGFLKRYELIEYFAGIMGYEIHPNKTEKIKMVFSDYGIGPENCIMITDTLGDVREAEEVGVGSIGVSWGYHRKQDMEKGGCFRVVDDPSEIQAAVGNFFSRENAS